MIKYIIAYCIIVMPVYMYAQVSKDSTNVMLYSTVKQKCHYLSITEKEVIQQLNIARMYPLWYAYFYLKNPKTGNEISLKQTLQAMQATTAPLIPDSSLWASEKCHAVSGGLKGITSHDRIDKNCKKLFSGECIDFGNHTAKDIVLSLLIDEGVASLGHRNIILNTNYKKIGVSIQSHKTYDIHAVIGFEF